MAPTLDEVRAVLYGDEPNYQEAARHLGPGALPHLAEIARSPEMMLAPKAVYLASLFRHPDATHILEQAAQSDVVLLRVAAATGVRNLPGESTVPLLLKLLRDADIGVRKTALQAAGESQAAAVRETVRTLSHNDSNLRLRELFAQVLERWR